MKGRRWALRGALLLMLTLGAGAQARKAAPEPPPARSGTLIDNINGITTDADGHMVRFTGLLIDADGRVTRRLNAAESRPDTVAYRLDGGGRTLIPAFVDGRGHLIDTGLAMMTIDLSATRTLAEGLTKIADDVRANPDRKWILGRGWDAARWGLAAPPTPAQLDAVSGDTPAWLLSADGETGWANSAAMRAAGIVKPLPPHEVQRRVRAIAPTPSPKERDIALDKAQRRYLAAGYAAVTDTALSIDEWQGLRRAGDRGALRLRVVGYARSLTDLVTIAGSEPSPWLYDGRLRLVGASFRLRGSLPAPNSPHATALMNQMSRAAMDGFQVALDVTSGQLPTSGNPHGAMFAELAATYTGDRRWRLDQGDSALITDANAAFRWSAQSSGSPSALPVPLSTLGALAGNDVGAGLAALTRTPAYASFAEDKYGALEPGQYADFVLIDTDISTALPAAIAAAQVLETWIGGQRAYVR